jgi:hypothetical protein
MGSIGSKQNRGQRETRFQYDFADAKISAMMRRSIEWIVGEEEHKNQLTAGG